MQYPTYRNTIVLLMFFLSPLNVMAAAGNSVASFSETGSVIMILIGIGALIVGRMAKKFESGENQTLGSQLHSKTAAIKRQ